MANRGNDDDGHIIEMGGRGGDDQRSSSSSSSSVAVELAISNQRRTASTSTSSSSSVVPNNSPLEYSGIWLCLQLIVSVIQIVASISVLWMSKRKGGDPDPKLFSWMLGYACACFLIIPLLCCRFLLRGTLNLWRYGTVEILKMSLSCCFAIWFVLGCVWVFGTSFSGDQNTKLETICLVLLASGCIVYALPFMRGAILCMLLPCLILPTLASQREQGGGDDSVDRFSFSTSALPIYKLFKQQSGESAGQLLLLAAAASTDHHHHNQRPISAEDAVCCICLGEYAEEEEVRELPCTHFFHVDCVDKWLNINARCPLCLSQIRPAPHGPGPGPAPGPAPAPGPSTSPAHSDPTNHNPITETA